MHDQSKKMAEYYNSLMRKVMLTLYAHKSASVAELTQYIPSSAPTITRNLQLLQEDGLIINDGLGKSVGGRKPGLYTINPDGGYFLTIYCGLRFTEIQVLRLDNTIYSEVSRIKLSLNEKPLEIIDNICTAVEEMCKKHKGLRVLAGAMSLPGLVDTNSGKSLSHFRHLEKSLAKTLEDCLKFPVYIENDARVLALSEKYFGPALKKDNVLVINIDEGIGMGIFINGQLYSGCHGFAGEFGHFRISENKKVCTCGKTGCLETVAAIPALEEMAMERMPQISMNDGDNIFEKMMQALHFGDETAAAIFAEAGHNIGKALAMLLHLFDPGLVILSGRVSMAGDFLLAPVMQSLNLYSIGTIKEHTEIICHYPGHQDIIEGLGALAFTSFFKK